MRQQMTKRDVGLAVHAEVGEKARHPVVEPKLAVARENHHRDRRRQRLGERRKVVDGFEFCAGERLGSIDLNPNAPSNAISAPRRTTTVAPGTTPCSTASLKACSTSLHPNAQHLRQPQLTRNCRLSENNPARGGIDPRRHAERNRKILGAMPRLDAVRAPGIRGPRSARRRSARSIALSCSLPSIARIAPKTIPATRPSAPD